MRLRFAISILLQISMKNSAGVFAIWALFWTDMSYDRSLAGHSYQNKAAKLQYRY